MAHWSLETIRPGTASLAIRRTLRQYELSQQGIGAMLQTLAKIVTPYISTRTVVADNIEVKFIRAIVLGADCMLPAHKIQWDKYYPATISEVGSCWDLDVVLGDGQTVPVRRNEVYPFGPLDLDKWIKQQRNEQWKARIKLRIKALSDELEALEKSDAAAQ
jgi:hypothetical protein